jgi:hypothetical protein
MFGTWASWCLFNVVICLAQHVPFAASDWSMRRDVPGGRFSPKPLITTQIVWRKEVASKKVLLRVQGHMASFKISTSCCQPPLSLPTPTSSPTSPSSHLAYSSPSIPLSCLKSLPFSNRKTLYNCDMAPVRFAFHPVCLKLTSRKTAAHQRSLRPAKFYSVYYGGKYTKAYRLGMKQVTSLSNSLLIFLERR